MVNIPRSCKGCGLCCFGVVPDGKKGDEDTGMCADFDHSLRICRDYENRPKMCRDFERGSRFCIEILEFYEEHGYTAWEYLMMTGAI